MTDVSPRVLVQCERGVIAGAWLGPLFAVVCGMREITDADWSLFLQASGTTRPSAETIVSYMHFLGPNINATQRKLTATYVKENQVPDKKRVAIVTDSDLQRGAMTALGYFLRNWPFRAFKASDQEGALRWLAEAAPFDTRQALVWLRDIYGLAKT